MSALAAAPQDDLKQWMTDLILDFVHGPENLLHMPTSPGEPAWNEPLLGFSRGDDPVFAAFKETVGPFHWTPWEIFTASFPGSHIEPGELTVVAWVLPQTQRTRDDNRQQRVYPAERWARARVYGEQVNTALRERVAARLQAAGCQAVAPMLSPEWKQVKYEPFVFSSTWSERHAAYASGLGTFGLCDGLITAQGKAVRIGSVIVRAQTQATPRPYTDHHAYCLFYSQGTCGDCIRRCPAGAISEAGHDKEKCKKHLDRSREYVNKTFGFAGYGCGLCQVGVPCESRTPPPSPLP